MLVRSDPRQFLKCLRICRSLYETGAGLLNEGALIFSARMVRFSRNWGENEVLSSGFPFVLQYGNTSATPFMKSTNRYNLQILKVRDKLLTWNMPFENQEFTYPLPGQTDRREQSETRTGVCPGYEVVISCIWENDIPKLRFSFRYADLDLSTWRLHFASGYFHVKNALNIPPGLLHSIGLKNYLIQPGAYPVIAEKEYLHVTF